MSLDSSVFVKSSTVLVQRSELGMEAALFSAVVNSLKAAVMTHVSGSGRGLFFMHWFFLSNSRVEYSVSRNLVSGAGREQGTGKGGWCYGDEQLAAV